MSAARESTLRPEDRLIVALDVPSAEKATKIVAELEGTVFFYKVGLELLMAGGMETLLRRLVENKRVFVDLKLPGDIPETIKRVVNLAADMGVTFMTLSATAPGVVKTAVAGRGSRPDPKLLFVPFLSSMDQSDFVELHGADAPTFEEFLRKRTASALEAGVDGFIVSGQEIGLVRGWYPGAVLVSPGIRPKGSSQDDHKRSCTPAEAIRLGADYIVVGRPIRDAQDRRGAARRILEELAAG